RLRRGCAGPGLLRLLGGGRGVPARRLSRTGRGFGTALRGRSRCGDAAAGGGHPDLDTENLLDGPGDDLVTAAVAEALGLVGLVEAQEHAVALDPDRLDVAAGQHHPGEPAAALDRLQDLLPGALDTAQVEPAATGGGRGRT